MDELRELYQQVILDHNKNPKNYGAPDDFTHDSEGYNPLCGDKVHVYLTVDGNKITDIHFAGSGCAISKASASLMTTILKGKTLAEAQVLFHAFQEMITSDVQSEVSYDDLGKLAVLAGVREFPSRIKCASLAWHTMSAATADGDETVSTE